MPQIGGITVPDDFRPPTSIPAAGRPSIGAVLGGATEQAYGQVRYGLPYAIEKQLGTANASDEAAYQAGLARTSEAANAAAPASFSDLTSGRVGFSRFVGENLASSAPQTLSTIIGGIVGARFGGLPGAIAGSTAVGTPQFVGSNVARAVQETGTLSEDAATRSLLTAPLQAASDSLVERYLPGAEKFLGGFAAHQTGNFIARTAKSIAKAGATEAVTEAGQQLGERVSAGLDVTGPQAAAEYVNAAATAFVIGGVLGAGGGVRRTAAHTTPAAAVTPDQLNEAIDAGLSPKPAITPVTNPTYQPSRLALPAPEAFAAPITVSPEGTAVTPAQAAATLDPSVLVQPAPVEGGAEARLAAARTLAEQSQAVGAEPGRIDLAVRDILAGRGGPAIPGALRAPAPTFDPATALQERLAQSQTSPLAIDASGEFNGVANEVQPRLFATEPVADLHTALAAKNASPEVKAEAQREVDQRIAEATGAAPLTTDNFQTRVDDAKAGLRNQFVQKLTAADPTELLNKVYDRVLVDQDTSAGTTKLAQRLGLLDDDLEPTAAANAIEAQRTAQAVAEATPAPGTPVGVAPAANSNVVPPAAPVSIAPQSADPSFKFNQLLGQAGVQRVSPATKAAIGEPVSLDDARQKVFAALATDSFSTHRGSNAAVTQVEKVAQHLGLITNDDARDVTPLGRKTYLATPDGGQAAAEAAVQQGYTGSEAATFTAGVQAVATGNETAKHTSFEDLAAYQAGKVYAQDFVSRSGVTAAQTTAIQARQDTRATGTAVPREDVKANPLTPAQINQRGLNQLLDAADLRTTSDSDVAALRRLVRDGATPAEVGAALRKVQGGTTLFQQPATVPSVLPGLPTRGQPIFKELNTREGTTPSRAAQRAETQESVRAFDQRNTIREALLAKEITVSRANKLNDMLDDGKVSQVERLTKDFGSIKRSEEGRAALALEISVGHVDAQFEQAITGKSFVDVAQHMIDNAPSAQQRVVMTNILRLAKELEKSGSHTLNIKVVGPGAVVPARLGAPGVRAFTQLTRVPAIATVYLKSAESGPDAGTNYQLAAHEMVHAVTMQLLDRARRGDPNGNTTAGRAARDLTKLANDIIRHVNGRLDNLSSNALNTQSVDEARRVEIEIGHALGEHNAFADPDEVLAWGLTNPLVQRYLQGIEIKPRETVWQRFVGLVQKLLGLPPKTTNAFEELLRVSEQVFDTTASNVSIFQQAFAPQYSRNDPSADDNVVLQAAAQAGGFGAAARTVDATNDVTKQVVSTLGDVVDRISPENLASKFRATALGWLSRNQITRLYGQRVPGLLKLSEAFRTRDAISGRVATIGNSVVQGYDRLLNANKEQGQRVSALANLATQFRLDPFKAFDAHTHLQDDPNVVALRRLHGEAVKLKNDLSRGDGAGIKVFNDLRAANEFQNVAQLSGSLYSLIATDRELALGVAGSAINPVQTFNAQAGLTTPQEARDYFAQVLNQQLAAATAFIRKRTGEVASGTESDIRGLKQHLNPLQEKISEIYNALARAAEAPYFHLGRFGDNFGSAQITLNTDGTVNKESQRIVAEALSNGNFGIAEISTDNTRPRFSLRFETVDQTNAFAELARQLEADGHLTPDTLKYGPRTRADNYGVGAVLPDFIRRAEANIDTNPSYIPDSNATAQEKADLLKAKDAAKQAIRDVWLENQGDNSISKVLTARHVAPGFSADFIRSYSHRFDVGGANLATIGTAPDFDAAYGDIRQQTLESLSASNPDDANVLTAVQTEVKRRQANSVLKENVTTFDKARALGHAYFLGFSPAYGLVNLTQVGVVAIPELAKAHGFVQSFHAIRRATPIALKILNIARQEAFSQGAKHAADVVLTESVIQKAGVDQNTAAFLRKIIASGTVDIGSAARALGQISSGRGSSKLDIGLKYASAVGLYTETFSRLATALAAHDLHKGNLDSSVKYATKTVSESLFDYQNWNTGRQLGKQGFAGPVTPLLTQFSSYSIQITEKLYSEVLDAFSKQRPGESDAETAERRAGSRRFLLGHLTAVTALAGTLGLPFASVAATVVERLVGAARPGDEPYDATASYRNFLAGVFGKDVAEVVARGAPRALGFDVSQRAGEADLLPFSQLLGDRRSWKDSVQATLGRSIGATPSAGLSILDSGNQFLGGDFVGGSISLLPVGFKAIPKAYQLSTEGYVDTKGRKLPLTPGAGAILYQLLGFGSAEKAEYSEARGDQQSRRLALTTQAGGLRNRIVRAITNGDSQSAQELIAKAQEFDQSNPSFAIIPSLQGAVLRQAQSQARARALGTPTGVGIQDIAGRQLTSYANVNYQ